MLISVGNKINIYNFIVMIIGLRIMDSIQMLIIYDLQNII